MEKDIVVCVKQVPDVTEVKLNPETHTLIRESVPSILNPFDAFGVEEAVRIRERYGGKVIAVTMGPPQAESVIQTCFEMGVDEGYLLCDERLAGSDTWATSIALARLINRFAYDLIICGVETTDSSTAQVGPEVAEKLGIPQITFVSRVELGEENRKGRFTKETDTGYQVLDARLPILISVVKGINEPRQPDPAAAGSKQVQRLTISDIAIDAKEVGLDGSPTMVVEINAAKPHASAQLVVDAGLPAHERINLIMRGGIQKKEGSELVEGDTAGMAKKAGEFICELIGT